MIRIIHLIYSAVQTVNNLRKMDKWPFYESTKSSNIAFNDPTVREASYLQYFFITSYTQSEKSPTPTPFLLKLGFL